MPDYVVRHYTKVKTKPRTRQVHAPSSVVLSCGPSMNYKDTRGVKEKCPPLKSFNQRSDHQYINKYLSKCRSKIAHVI